MSELTESELKSQAETLGIKVPGTWGGKRIQAEIERVLDTQPKTVTLDPDETKVPMLLKVDYWPEEGGERHKAGKVVEIPVSKAKELLKAGKAERADAMPGDDE